MRSSEFEELLGDELLVSSARCVVRPQVLTRVELKKSGWGSESTGGGRRGAAGGARGEAESDDQAW